MNLRDKNWRKNPAVVNFCKREQGLLLQKENPKKIRHISDLSGADINIVNRSVGTGTRLLFDKELKKAGVKGDSIKGYHHEVERHMDIGLEILAGRADAGPGIRYIAALLNLDFIPLRWERYDLLIAKERFFDKGIQLFLGLFHEISFQEMAAPLTGYDLSTIGKMIFPDGFTPS